jgi:hypothetical protein
VAPLMVITIITKGIKMKYELKLLIEEDEDRLPEIEEVLESIEADYLDSGFCVIDKNITQIED